MTLHLKTVHVVATVKSRSASTTAILVNNIFSGIVEFDNVVREG